MSESGYMATALAGVTDDVIQQWLVNAGNLAQRNKRQVGDFKIIHSIDGNNSREDRAVALVKITSDGDYPQHVHKKSDALFVIVSGNPTLVTGDKRIKLQPGDRVQVPRGMPHGFEFLVGEGQKLESTFISIQSPPIRHRATDQLDMG